MFREINCSSSVVRTWQDENLLGWTYSITFRLEDGFMSSQMSLTEKALDFFLQSIRMDL